MQTILFTYFINDILMSVFQGLYVNDKLCACLSSEHFQLIIRNTDRGLIKWLPFVIIRYFVW